MRVKSSRSRKISGGRVRVPKRLPEIVIYTDGGASPNPGRGGYGILIYLKDHDVIELSQGYRYTTNNRMEIMAVIAALEYVEERGIDGDIVIYSDSQQVIQAINGWIFNWLKSGWKKKDGGMISNVDLWKRYTRVWGLRKDRGSKVYGNWVKGHAGLPQNEKCDELASIALCSDNLLEDEGYIPVDDSMSSERPLRPKYSYSRRDYKRDDRSSNGYRKTYDYRDRYTSL